MDEIQRIVLSSSATLLGGMILFLFGQWVLKAVLEPLQEQARTIGEVAKAIVFYSNTTSFVLESYYANLARLYAGNDPMRDYLIERNKQMVALESDRIIRGSDDLRRLACELLSRTEAIPFYPVLGRLLGRPSLTQISEASRQLMGFSNSLSGPMDHTDRIAEVVRSLKLKTLMTHLGVK